MTPKIFVVKKKKKYNLERTGEGIDGGIDGGGVVIPTPITDDEVYNPSIRGKRRNISWIIRCPKGKSKISIGTCRGCSYFGGVVDNCVICSWRKEK